MGINFPAKSLERAFEKQINGTWEVFILLSWLLITSWASQSPYCLSALSIFFTPILLILLFIFWNLKWGRWDEKGKEMGGGGAEGMIMFLGWGWVSSKKKKIKMFLVHREFYPFKSKKFPIRFKAWNVNFLPKNIIIFQKVKIILIKCPIIHISFTFLHLVKFIKGWEWIHKSKPKK